MSATVAHPGWRLDPRLGRGLAGLIVPLALLALWQTAAARGWLPPQILPSPADTWASGVDLWTTGELPGDIAISLLRVVEGFLVGALFGFVLGSAMGLSPVIEDYVRPLFIAIAQVPSLGWIPFLMLFLGIGETLKVVVIAKAALIPVTLNTFSGVRAIPLTYREVARALGFTRWQTLTRLVLPGAIPQIFTGIRYGLTHAWLALIAVELLASSEGLGYLLVYGRQMFWLDTVVMAMVLIGVIGFVLDYGLALAERRLQRWRVAGVAVGHAP